MSEKIDRSRRGRIDQPIDRSIDRSLRAHHFLFVGRSNHIPLAKPNSYPSLKAFIERFSDARPLALARSALHLQLAPRSWEHDPASAPPWALSAEMLHKDMVGTSLLATEGGGGSGAPPPPPSPAMDTLLEQAVIALGNWVQATLLNRARQRRRLRRGCEDMANLFQHALIAEACPLVGARLVAAGWRMPAAAAAAAEGEGPLATWVAGETCAQMLKHLSLSFELELVETASEVAAIAWYMDYLAASRQAALQALGAWRGAAVESAVAVDRQLKQVELLALDAQRAMAQGTFRLALALQSASEAEEARMDAEKYELRFGWTGSLERPEPLTHASFERASDVSVVPVPRLLALAGESLGRARMLAAGDESTLKVASKLLAAASVVASAPEQFSAAFVGGQGGWPVVSVVRRK